MREYQPANASGKVFARRPGGLREVNAGPEEDFALGAESDERFIRGEPPHTGLITVPPVSQSASDPLSGRIHTIRGQRVILDTDLARLYGVPTFRFNEAVKRNAGKFPDDFRFQLTREERADLLSQSAIAEAAAADRKGGKPNSSQSAMSSRHRGAAYRPWAFTEHGCLMAATVLNSPRAVQMSLYVIRAFVQMREALATNQSVLRRLAEIDQTLLEHDAALRTLWGKLRPLLAPPPEPPRKEMGFHTKLKKG